MANAAITVTGKLALIQMGLTRPQDVKDMADCRSVIDTFVRNVRNERTIRMQVDVGLSPYAELVDAVNAVTLSLNQMDGHS